MAKIVLLRHGKSVWNKENRFTGWEDVALAPEGEEEARQAGWLLKQANIKFDVVHASSLQRAENTAVILLNEMERADLIANMSLSEALWERHYGSILTGKNKDDAVTIHGYTREQVHTFRRACDAILPHKDGEIAGKDWENLRHVIQRVEPYLTHNIKPALKEGKNVLVVAHGNTNRALIKLLREFSEKAIEQIEPGTAVPTILELDEDNNLEVVESYYLKSEAGFMIREPF
ncbi:MAG: 2,3-diphosphoglycerate-dependent phosphoglycerate mutase [Alphaproteobacteria bacterium]